MIKELNSTTFDEQPKEKVSVVSPLVPVFSWDKSERVEAKY